VAKFVKKQALLLVMLAGTVLGGLIPEAGIALKAYGLVPYIIVAIFLCQGASLDTAALTRPGRYMSAIVVGGVIALLIAPVLGWCTVRLLGWQDDRMVGFLLICTMSPTLVSGTVIAVQANGDRAASLILTVVLNALSVVTIPLHLGWMLREEVAIDRPALLLRLVLLVLLPAIVGHLMRRRWQPQMVAAKPWLTYGPIVCMGTIVFMGVSEQAERLATVEILEIAGLIPPALTVHTLLLFVGLAAARLLSMETGTARALAIVCSQKTIPLALAIWSTVFAADYPLALVPPLVFHLGQIYLDTLIANIWQRRDSRAAATETAE
jgi:predicted Na+-dependent transporter